MTIKSFKGRTIEAGDKVKAYFDLHRKTFSLQIGNLVHGKSNVVKLQNCGFIVEEKKRLKVVETGVKNVHAKVHGTLVETERKSIEDIFAEGYRQAHYDPKVVSHFVDKETFEAIHNADEVILQDKKIFYKQVVNK